MQDHTRFRAHSYTKTLRSGKWTAKEEKYARAVIQAYGLGLLDLPTGEQSLRSFLAKKLLCSPSRITKKFKGQTPMNILDAQRSCRSRLREGCSRSNEDRDATTKALGILEREFLTELALIQEAKASSSISSVPQIPSPVRAQQWVHPQTLLYSPTKISSPLGGSNPAAPAFATTMPASFATSPIMPQPPIMPIMNNNDQLLQVSLTLNTVLSSLLQSTCARNHSVMMLQQRSAAAMANLSPRTGPNIFQEPQMNQKPQHHSPGAPPTQAPMIPSPPTPSPQTQTAPIEEPKSLSGMDLLCNVADQAAPLHMKEPHHAKTA